jgi:hypothetical protein
MPHRTIIESLILQKATAANGTDVYVVVYNSLGSARSTVIHLPVSTNGIYHVSKVGSADATSALVSSYPSSSTSVPGSAKYAVHFDTGPLPPLGARIFLISLTNKSTASVMASALESGPFSMQQVDQRRDRTTFYHESNDDVEAANEFFSVVFDG